MEPIVDDIFAGALRLLPDELRRSCLGMEYGVTRSAEEIHLRVGQPVTVLVYDGERAVSELEVTENHIKYVIDVATGASLYSSRDSIRSGYITVKGGYRIGICGTVLNHNGVISGFKTVSSLNIRLPRQMTGLAESIWDRLWKRGKLISTLIVSPPGGGKTTLLRDIIRTASYGDRELGIIPQRVSVADERGEIASLCGGTAAMDVGPHTDILDSCARAEGIMMLLRAMSPEIIAFDEITAPSDAAAAETAARCGVTLLATAHGCGIQDITEKAMYRNLFYTGVFSNVVLIERRNAGRRYRVVTNEEVCAVG